MSEELEIPGFPLRLATNARGGARTFKTLDNYQQWLSSEKSIAEQWVRSGSAAPGNWGRDTVDGTTRFFQLVEQQIDEIPKALRQYENDPRRLERTISQAVLQITQHHDANYKAGRLFTSDSAEGRLLTRIATNDSARALGAFVALRSDASATGAFIRGLTDGSLFRLGVKGRAEAEGDALTAMAAEWHDRFQNAEDSREVEYRETLTSNQEALASLREEHKVFMSELEGNQQAQAERFHEIVQAAETDLDLLRETYRQRLGLSAPVSYWKRKADTHRLLGVGAFILVLLAGGGFGWFFLRQVAAVLRPGVDAGTAEVVVLLTLATLGVWAVRIFVRLFFSQVHLNTDARERAVMIETFLALLTSEDAEKDERLLVLQTIFRPTSTGIVKDDAAPPSVASEISRILSR